jgi:hypothetical protein
MNIAQRCHWLGLPSLPLLAGWLASCSAAKPVEPDPPPNPVLGTYRASSLIVVIPGQTIDVLASGGVFTMTLTANVDRRVTTNGTTGGRLIVPGGGTNGQNLDANMDGVWNQAGTTVRFTQNADTFVRDATWTVDTQTLRTTLVSGTTTVTAVLTKQ